MTARHPTGPLGHPERDARPPRFTSLLLALALAPLPALAQPTVGNAGAGADLTRRIRPAGLLRWVLRNRILAPVRIFAPRFRLPG